MELEDVLSNLCADVVERAAFEPALVYLLRDRRAGEWVPVAELYRIAGESSVDLKPEVAAAWLPSPTNQPGYAVIFFCDDELMWSLTAYYNVARLFESATATAAAPGPVR